jgi:hypothetical protein
MLLRVRIEEGPTSKAVLVGRMQYCQYSQEKIRLITLLSDHVCAYPFSDIILFNLHRQHPTVITYKLY